MFKKYLIVASKKDKAGINITTQLSQFQKENDKFGFYLVEDEAVYSDKLDMERINQYDFVIFASKHQSESKMKTLSIHAPGNWRQADFGGIPGKVCKTSALFMKQLFQALNVNVLEYNLSYEVTMECTHHGPFIEKPCVFIEIGSTENEWIDRRAGFVVAKTINDIINNVKENPYNEIAFAIGGPHYCPNFNKIQMNSNVAIGHIIPEYSLPLTEEMVKEAIAKTKEEIDFALLDWKGLGQAEKREEIIKILDKLYIRYERTSEINKR